MTASLAMHSMEAAFIISLNGRAGGPRESVAEKPVGAGGGRVADRTPQLGGLMSGEASNNDPRPGVQCGSDAGEDAGLLT